MNKSQKKTVWVYGFFWVAAFFLFFTNIGNHYLWQDEAQTALISKTILDRGMPFGSDGRNFFSQELGAEYGRDYIWKWHTWLPFYILALFFKILGLTTFAARLPFALFGLGTVYLAFRFSGLLNPRAESRLLPCLVMASCIAFLILSRQCRYYPMAAFFSLAGLVAYRAMLCGRRFSAPVFAAAATFLFHVHYVYCFTLLVSALLHSLVFHRTHFKKTLVSAFAVAAVNGPWLVWLSGMKYGDVYGAALFDPARFFKSVQVYLKYIFTYVFFPFLVIFPAARRFREPFMDTHTALPVIFIIVNVIVLSLVNPAPFFRYIAPVIPPLCLLAGWIIGDVYRKSRVGAAAVFVVSVLYCGNFFNYLYELTHDYDGPVEGIVKYLREYGSADDVVVITYGDMPLKFYTGMRVLGGLTGEDLSPAGDADWVVIRRNIISRKDLSVRRYIEKNINLSAYEKIIIDYPDTAFENRESPELHNFRTVENINKVVIWRKKTG